MTQETHEDYMTRRLEQAEQLNDVSYRTIDDYMTRRLEQAEQQPDVIKNPRHYEQYEFEPVSFIMKNELSFWMGNVIKYVMRAGTKDDTDEVQDLKKAIRYIEMRINQLEGREPNE